MNQCMKGSSFMPKVMIEPYFYLFSGTELTRMHIFVIILASSNLN